MEDVIANIVSLTKQEINKGLPLGISVRDFLDQAT